MQSENQFIIAIQDLIKSQEQQSQHLVKSQEQQTQYFIKLIEASEARSIKRNEESEARSLKRDEETRIQLNHIAEEIRKDVKPLKDEQTGKTYYQKNMGKIWIMSGALVIGFLFWLADNFDILRQHDLTKSLQIEQIFDKLEQVFDRLDMIEHTKGRL